MNYLSSFSISRTSSMANKEVYVALSLEPGIKWNKGEEKALALTDSLTLIISQDFTSKYYDPGH